MKNLENYGVQELNAAEKISVAGGWAHTYYVDGHKYVDSVRWNNGHKEIYARSIDGVRQKRFKSIIA
jgi:hypothetical protein